MAREVATFLAWAAAMGLLVGLTLTGWRPLQAIVGITGQRAGAVVQVFERRFPGKPKAVARCEADQGKRFTIATPAVVCESPGTSSTAPSLLRIHECEEGFQRAHTAKHRDLTDAEIRKARPLLADVHEQVRQLAAGAHATP